MEQDLKKLDVTKLHPLSPEVISRQATINIGNFSFVYDSFVAHYYPSLHCVQENYSRRDLILVLKLIHYLIYLFQVLSVMWHMGNLQL